MAPEAGSYAIEAETTSPGETVRNLRANPSTSCTDSTPDRLNSPSRQPTWTSSSTLMGCPLLRDAIHSMCKSSPVTRSSVGHAKDTGTVTFADAVVKPDEPDPS